MKALFEGLVKLVMWTPVLRKLKNLIPKNLAVAAKIFRGRTQHIRHIQPLAPVAIMVAASSIEDFAAALRMAIRSTRKDRSRAHGQPKFSSLGTLYAILTCTSLDLVRETLLEPLSN